MSTKPSQASAEGRPLSIFLLGRPRILAAADQHLPIPARTDTQDLLHFLLLDAGVHHPRPDVAHRLWPDETETRAQTRLRRALHRLARTLDAWPAPARPSFHRDRQYLRLTLPAGTWIDLRAYAELEREIEGLLPGADGREGLLRRACALNAGPLLDGRSAAWLEAARRDLERRRLRDLRALERLEGRGAGRVGRRNRASEAPAEGGRPATAARSHREEVRRADARREEARLEEASFESAEAAGPSDRIPADVRWSEAARRAWANAPRPYPADPSSTEELCALLADAPAALSMAAEATDLIPARRLPELLEAGIEHLVTLRRDSGQPSRRLWKRLSQDLREFGTEERALLERLSLLPGPFLDATASALAGDGPRDGPLDDVRAASGAALVEALVAGGALIARPAAEDAEHAPQAPRLLRMPYDLRQVLRRGLFAQPRDWDRARARIRRRYVDLAREAGAGSRTEAQAAWMRQLDLEGVNIDHAMREIREAGSLEEALTFCSGVWVYWYVGGCGAAERDWIRAVVARGLREESGDRRALGSAAHGLGVLLYGEGEVREAKAALETSASLYRDLGDAKSRAAVLQHLALVSSSQGDLAGARRCRDESEALQRRLGREGDRTASLVQRGLTRGHIERSAGRPRAAYSLFRHSDRAFLQRGLPEQQRMHALSAAGEAALDLGMSRRAEALLVEALTIAEEIGSRANRSAIQDSLGRLYARQGRAAEGRQLLIRSLLIARELAEQSAVVVSLCNLAELELGALDVDKAGFLLREAARIAERIDDDEGRVYATLLLLECGVAARDSRRLDRAAGRLRAIGSPEGLDDSGAAAAWLRARAWAHSFAGEPEPARRAWLRSAEAYARREDAYETLRGLERLALFLELSGVHEGAHRALSLAGRIRAAIGTPRSAFDARLSAAIGEVGEVGDAAVVGEEEAGIAAKTAETATAGDVAAAGEVAEFGTGAVAGERAGTGGAGALRAEFRTLVSGIEQGGSTASASEIARSERRLRGWFGEA